MQVWKLTGHGLLHSFKNEHAKQSIFRNIGAGVMQIEVGEKKRIFSCGADGTLKMRMLPTALRTQTGIFDILQTLQLLGLSPLADVHPLMQNMQEDLETDVLEVAQERDVKGY